jgi:hypothetical protein
VANEDPAHLKWLRSLPCMACLAPPPSEAHHRTGAGMAARAPDSEAMPLCTRCHRDFHDGRGLFQGWTREMRRRWQLDTLEKVRALYDCEEAF